MTLAGFFVHGLSQARILEQVAIFFSRRSPAPGLKPMSPALAGGFFATEPSGKPTECNACVLSSFSYVQLCVTLWTVAHKPPLSMGFSRQEHWSGLPCRPPGDLPHPGTEPASLTSPALAGRFSTTSIGPQILSLEALRHSELLSFAGIFYIP